MPMCIIKALFTLLINLFNMVKTFCAEMRVMFSQQVIALLFNI